MSAPPGPKGRLGHFDPHIIRRLGNLTTSNMVWLVESSRSWTDPSKSFSLGWHCAQWLARSEAALPSKALERNRALIGDWIEPRWGSVAVDQLEISEFNEWYREVFAAKGLDTLSRNALNAIVLNGMWSAAIQQLLPGEEILAQEMVVPVWTATRQIRMGAAAGITSEAVLQRRGRKGSPGSTAMTLPAIKGSYLVVTPDHLALIPGITPAHVAWSVPRASVRGVEPRTTLAKMHQFRLRFDDGSAGAFLVRQPGVVSLLSGLLK